ncbi:MAG: hypothetical protein ABSD29_15045 [Verrucomicrobiota bacterium]|jgi:hypothetical protein
MINATPKQLRKAAKIQERIQSLQKELGQLLGGSDETAAIEAPRKRRKVSAAGRARMRAAQKARWARIKGTAPKKKISAQGLANIRAAQKARWAKVKAGKVGQKSKIQRSAAWRAAISAAAKARWARAKKAGKSRW